MQCIFKRSDISVYFQIRRKVTNDNCWLLYNLVEKPIVSIWTSLKQINE